MRATDLPPRRGSAEGAWGLAVGRTGAPLARPGLLPRGLPLSRGDPRLSYLSRRCGGLAAGACGDAPRGSNQTVLVRQHRQGTGRGAGRRGLRRFVLSALAACLLAGCGDEEPASHQPRLASACAQLDLSGALSGAALATSGTETLAQCRFAAGGARARLTLDQARDAFTRYSNRITELSQFSSGDPSRAPQAIGGVGNKRLGPAGANWLPRLGQIISSRDDKELIVDVSIDGGSGGQRKRAAIAVSKAIWEILAPE